MTKTSASDDHEPGPAVEASRGDAFGRLLAAAGDQKGKPPVERWNPEYCGEIGMRIAADGTWFYRGTPIGRRKLVQLFSTILRRDPERYVLVTPVERVGIEVEDAPFLAVEMAVEGHGATREISFRTNVDDVVQVGPDHRLRFETQEDGGVKPYVLVRGDLWALVTRALMFDLIEMGEERVVDGETVYGLDAGGVFHVIARDGGHVPGTA
ncbi:MAG: DUF1285 domain-containing protein [Salinarimonas sp.]|nr:DUF1285 domain-containing protein [Salinarimonas sp.]